MPARPISTLAGLASPASAGASATASGPKSRATTAANEIDSIRGFNLAPVGRTGGWQSTYGVMVNAFYDFDFANFGLGQSIFQPYVGVGAGYAWTDWRNVRGQSNCPGLGARHLRQRH